MNRKDVFCVGLVLAGLVTLGTTPSEAAAKARTKTTAKSARAAAAKRATVYSAERSQSRKVKLARARAVATAREMADTVLPRYKVAASGRLVLDVRAAAAIL